MSKLLIVNAKADATYRRETLEGRQYLVVPTVMLVEGVFTANEGPLYYDPNSYGESAPAWNLKPIVVYHPTDDAGGFISAADPSVLESARVGFLMNTKCDGRLIAEAWIDEEKAGRVDDRITTAILNGKPMEVSTGMISDIIEETGTFNGVDYVGKVVNIRPDHFALLPDKKGACSLRDGAGLLVMQDGSEELPEDLAKAIRTRVNEMISNQLSHDQLREALKTQLKVRLLLDGMQDTYCWVCDVYQTFFIAEINNRLWKIGFSMKKNSVTLDDGNPVEVVRVTEYKTIDGKFVGNESLTGEKNVKKEEIIGSLIANGAFEESDREFLNGKDEATLTKLHAKMNPAPATPAPATSGNLVANSQPEPITWEGLLSKAPPEYRAAVNRGIAVLNQQIAENKKTILEGSDLYTEAELNAMDPDLLAKTAKLVANTKASKADTTDGTDVAPLPAYYGGSAPMFPPHFLANSGVSAAATEVLEIPSTR